MLKRTMLALAVVISAFAAAPGQSPDFERAAHVSSSSNSSFVVGERLVYEVSWADFLVAGELTIETKDRQRYEGVDGYHVGARAESVGLVTAFAMKIDDIYESFIDASTLLPFKAEKQMRHGKKRQQTSVTLDQVARTARTESGRTIQLKGETHDLVGLLFAIRSMDLTPGKSRTFNLIEDDKLYSVQIEPEGKEKIVTRAGTFDAIRVATRMANRANDKLSNLKLYISTDPRRIPVQITAEPSWGNVRVQLVSATPAIRNKR